ncbi:hypothetical protein IWQ60_008272 [Tieghemiomyces parasiticus]|uniref:Uncharacterized protein n=1 Tax=Tieghemiomyces parasiticus TaxID=78921 RepID=A0A9W8A2E4_9FUNG|nr:hypothetical protein IWQ60_008272 [Tieghemiomyces parasiticus]
MAKLTKEALPPFGMALTGAASAALALLCVYPLDTIKTRMQIQSKALAAGGTRGFEEIPPGQLEAGAGRPAEEVKGKEQPYTSVWDAAQQIYHREGLRGFYAGLAAGLVGQTSTNFAYFYWYSFVRRLYLRRPCHSSGDGSISTLAELALGAVAAALAQLFTIPVSVVATRQQTARTEERLGMLETAREIIADDGWTGLWKGLKPSLVLVVNPSITYGAFERIKAAMRRTSEMGGGSERLSALQVFVAGALSKTLATVVTYPYIMAKVRLQWKPSKSQCDAETHQRYAGAVDVLRRVWQTDGFVGWYKGMGAQISKAVLTQALLLMIKDKLESYIIVAFALLRVLRQRA